MIFKPKRRMVAGEHRHPNVPDKVPPDLDSVKVTIWNKPGDHPSVQDAKGLTQATGELIDLGNGQKAMKLVPVAGIVRNVIEGVAYDHIVQPGYAILENVSDGIVWAVSPEHLKAWFDKVSD